MRFVRRPTFSRQRSYPRRPDPSNPEASYLRPTPFGEIFDVLLTSASLDTLLTYPVILLAGDIIFDQEFLGTLEKRSAREAAF